MSFTFHPRRTLKKVQGVGSDHVGWCVRQATGGSQKTYVSGASYAAHGALGALKLGNNLWEHTRYNTRLQPEHIGLGTASTDSGVLALDYSYGTTNNNGNVRSQTISLPGLTLTQSYTYDELNRLKSAHETTGQTQSWRQEYSYTDANGDYGQFGNRRLSVSETPWLVTENPQFNPANNRIAPQAGEQYAYDAAGNLTKDKGGNAFAYDGENRQTLYNGGASVNGGATYSYDGDGKRVKKVAGVVSTIFVYDAVGRMVAEYSSEAAASNGTQYLTSDNLGTPRVVTLADGMVKARHDYLPFGEEVGAGVGGRTTAQGYVNDDVRQQFAGSERDDETGLDFMQTRYYASAQGRFTSTDPLYFQFMMAIDPQRFNLYTYARNNPLKFVDPDGEKIYVRGSGVSLLYDLAGGQEAFDANFQVVDGQVVLREGVDASKFNAGLQELLGLVQSTDNYLAYAGTDGEAAARLFEGSVDSKGKLTSLGKARAKLFTGDNPARQGGALIGTNGRSESSQPAKLANGDPVFFVIALNTNAVFTQDGVAFGNVAAAPNESTVYEGLLLAIASGSAQQAGLNKQIRPGSYFIHEAAENQEFARQRNAGKPFNYGLAHNAAIEREAVIRREMGITGGFAGGQIKSRVPKQ